ncbi:protein phytoclock 1 [Arabis alpina]|uniref:Protein phytoclock 1 n=1 Tax=Arabis alpina TaxID=50452 RepID=A0A087GC81_ARAAL|nr:protein phytoclock 1 [Arabis alpina]
MGEEVRMSEYGVDGEYSSDGEEDKVPEWEIGLPNGDDLTPLSQSLVPSILAVAFMITPERSRTVHDVNRASKNTISSLRSNGSPGVANASVAVEEEVNRVGSSSPESDLKKQKKSDGGGEAEEGDSETEDVSEKTTLKRPRLVWTPKLHKRFVEVVAHLGIKNAVPKTIMQLMNVEGLSRENVASHLQKYRLYLKRIHEDPSSSDHLFSSTLVPPQNSFKDGGIGNRISIPVPSIPVYGQHMGTQGYHNGHNHHHKYHNHGNGVFESNQYTMQQSKFGSMVTSPSVGSGGVKDK